MAQVVLAKEKFIFSASAKTIQFCSVDFYISKVKAITNVTRGVMMYLPQQTALKGTFNSTTCTLTMEYTTAGFADTDEIQVIYDRENTYSRSFDYSFSINKANAVDTRFLTLVQAGSGMTVNQTSGNLVITAGTTAKAETIIRSNIAFTQEFLASVQMMKSGSIINNLYSFMLADKIGENLAINISSATACTVVVPNTNPYYPKFKEMLTESGTALNGMKMFIGALAGNSGGANIGGQYAIASAVDNTTDVTLTFTVASFLTGTGTCCLYGWNYVHWYENAASATTSFIDCGRMGRASNLGDVSTTTITSASACHRTINKTSTQVVFSDTGITTAAVYTQRATRTNSIPQEESNLFLYIIVRNGTTAPASSTTFTTYAVRVEEMNSTPVSINQIKNTSGSTAQLGGLPSTLSSSAVTISSGTVTTVTGVTGLAAYNPIATSALPSTTYHLLSAATTNLTNVKASAGNILGGCVSNNGAAVAYFKIYNKASAPAPATDTPIATILIPVNSTVMIGSIVPLGFRCSTGISFSIVGGMPLTDVTAVAANQVSVHLNYN